MRATDPRAFVARTLGAVLVAATFTAGGCHDPRCVERQERRYRRIDRTIASVQERDERRPRQIQWLTDTYDRQEKQRAKHLQTTLRQISDRFDRDAHYFAREGPVLQSRLERLWNGCPEKIPDVWAQLIY